MPIQLPTGSAPRISARPMGGQKLLHLPQVQANLPTQHTGPVVPVLPPIIFAPRWQDLPFDLHELSHMTEANLIPLMRKGDYRVLEKAEYVDIHLQITWGGYAPVFDYVIPARGITRAALAIKVANAFYEFIKHNVKSETVPSMNMGPFTVNWDCVTRLRLKSLHNMYSHHWMAMIVMVDTAADAN